MAKLTDKSPNNEIHHVLAAIVAACRPHMLRRRRGRGASQLGLYSVCIHEAGHAVAALALGAQVTELRVAENCGHVRYSQRLEQGRDVITSMAGAVAELLYDPAQRPVLAVAVGVQADMSYVHSVLEHEPNGTLQRYAAMTVALLRCYQRAVICLAREARRNYIHNECYDGPENADLRHLLAGPHIDWTVVDELPSVDERAVLGEFDGLLSSRLDELANAPKNS